MNEVYAEILSNISNVRTFVIYQPFSAVVACIHDFVEKRPRQLTRYEGDRQRTFTGVENFDYHITIYSENRVHTLFCNNITLKDRSKHTELTYMCGGEKTVNFPVFDESIYKAYQDRAGIFDKLGGLKDYHIRENNEVQELLKFLTEAFASQSPKPSLIHTLQNDTSISGAWRLAQYQQLASKYAASSNPDPNIAVVEAIAEEHHIHIYIRHNLIHCTGLNGHKLKTEHIAYMVKDDEGNLRTHTDIAHPYSENPQDKDKQWHIFQLPEIRIAFDNIAKELNALESIPATISIDDFEELPVFAQKYSFVRIPEQPDKPDKKPRGRGIDLINAWAWHQIHTHNANRVRVKNKWCELKPLLNDPDAAFDKAVNPKKEYPSEADLLKNPNYPQENRKQFGNNYSPE